MSRNPEATITIKNHLAELERFSQFIGEFATRHAIPAKAAFEIGLAVDEVLTNIISYAYDDDLPHQVTTRLLLTPAELRIEIEDDGRPFDPTTAAAPPIDQPLQQRTVGRLGLHLVRRVTDGLEYRRDGGKNVLTLRKALHRSL